MFQTTVTYTAPTAADNCGMSAFYGDATSGDIFAVGTTTVTYTASDIHGNVNTASFTVTVTDDENPVISPDSGRRDLPARRQRRRSL